MIRLATTGRYLEDGRLLPYPAKPFLGLVIARSLLALLPASRDRDQLLNKLLRMGESTPDPLSLFRKLAPGKVAASVRPLVRLLGNQNADRFYDLYDALSPALRGEVRRLSPLFEAGRLRAPVYIASAPEDKYFPLSQTRELAAAATHSKVSLTVTSTLHHAIPSVSLLGPRRPAPLQLLDGAEPTGGLARLARSPRRRLASTSSGRYSDGRRDSRPENEQPGDRPDQADSERVRVGAAEQQQAGQDSRCERGGDLLDEAVQLIVGGLAAHHRCAGCRSR